MLRTLVAITFSEPQNYVLILKTRLGSCISAACVSKMLLLLNSCSSIHNLRHSELRLQQLLQMFATSVAWRADCVMSCTILVS